MAAPFLWWNLAQSKSDRQSGMMVESMLNTFLFSLFGLRLPYSFFESADAYASKNSRNIPDGR
ncbi:MAG: hypothetical protein ACI38O_04675 [Fibrobacter intestinalis]|uniref:hypothetical protein n=1 Tax=Fibrobacter intestinalis TaxID=28122 RepID=UPI003F1147F6